MSVHWPIYRRLLRAPFSTCVVDDRRSYRGIDMLVGSLHAAALIEKVCDTPTVGVMLPTSGVFPITALGTWALGKTIVPLNYLLKPAELQYVIDDCETDTIVTVGPMLDFVGQTPKVKNIVRLDEADFKKPPKPRLPARTKASETAAIVYTSGTSGKPKGVVLSHGALRANASQGAKGMGLRPSDRMIGVLPQFHCYGLTQLSLTPLIHGATAIYTARFQPKKLIELVKTQQATTLVAIPSMLNALAAVKSASPQDLASLRIVVSGSEALPDAVFERFREKFNIEIREGYGMTEMAPATHCNLEGKKRHTVGPPLPHVEQRIVHKDTGEDLPPGEDGEIRLRGPNMMDGYFKLPDRTAEVIDDKGFYRTGDLGRIDEDGCLYITGRIKEMIIVGGENVFPREIESVIETHPSVNAVGVIGVSDDVRGEVPVAFVELAEGVDKAEFDEKALISLCREHLAGYKAPRRVYLVDKLPRNPTGKILRRELAEMIPAGE